MPITFSAGKFAIASATMASIFASSIAAAAVAKATIDDGVTGSSNNQFDYQGNWQDCRCGTLAHGGAFHYAFANGASVTLRFRGTHATVHSIKEVYGGIASVTLDGKPLPDVDLYSESTNEAAVLTTPVLPMGDHTLTLAVTGRHNPWSNSGSVTINIDKAVVFSGDSTSSPSSGTWLSGGSGNGVPSGEFGAWRGRPVEMAVTWADDNNSALNVWQCAPGADYGNWKKPLEVAIGAIDDSESWAAGATGAYDERWRATLQAVRDKCGDTSSAIYIRFAHEMNGNWYPWRVNVGNHQDFIASWKRFRALQKEVFPASKLVFSVNRESVANGIDWRKTFPGTQYVDVMSVDYYNQYPYVATAADWNNSVNEVDGYGAPKGLQKHLDFARSVGLPLAVSEWSGSASRGDSPEFMQQMHNFFSKNGGTGAGNILYEALFNVPIDDLNWELFPETHMPASAARYKQLW